jgi:transposase
VIVVGIDPHKNSHTAVALDEACKERGQLMVPARQGGHERLLEWARGLHQDRVFALEDGRHVTGGLERFLLARGERVLRVPPKLMAGVRRSARSFGKSDPIDARAVAQAAIREPDLPQARVAGAERDLHLLISHREDLIQERTRIQNRVRWHLHDLDPELAVPSGVLDREVWLAQLVRALDRYDQTVQVRIARRLLTRCSELTHEVKALDQAIGALVRQEAPELLALPGCGTLTAAKLVAETAGVDRFSTEARYAAHAGVAPLEASSGDRPRHRLSRHGNRQLNLALHRIAVTQGRIHAPAKAFLARKQAEGKSRLEALRCLKRHLARTVYTILRETQGKERRAWTQPEPAIPVPA